MQQTPARSHTKSRKGFVLFTVLGILAILSTLMIAISINTRSVTKEVTYIRKTANFPALAKSGLELAAAKILAREEPKPLSGAFSFSTASGSGAGTYRNLAGLVDLNSAPMELLSALMKSAFANEADSQELAALIIDWRDDNQQREIDGQPEAADYAGTRNTRPKNAPFQSLLELAQLPQMNPALLSSIFPRATVFSGKPTLHAALADPSVLLHLNGLQPTTVSALRALVQSTGTSSSLQEIINSDPVLQTFVDRLESSSWAIEMTLEAPSGLTRNISATIAFLANDTLPYRVLSYEGPLEKAD